MMRYLPLLLAFAAPATAVAAPHAGLLTNPEMAIVLHNAEATQKLLFPEQKLSACWPYDEGAKKSPLTGTVYCKVETPVFLNNALKPKRGPDLFCSYLREEYCDMKPADMTR